jgi:hypothetical protein
VTPPKSVLRKAAAPAGACGGAVAKVANLAQGAGGAAGGGGAVLPDSGYDFLEGSGFVLEGLEEKGLDAKSYIQVFVLVYLCICVYTSSIQTMLRRTEGSSKEEQIIQKEQILAELQRVEKELQVLAVE